jgi:hypothetical protein
MRRLFELRPWYKLVPDQSVVAAGQGEAVERVQAARATDGSFIIAYLPVGGAVGINMNKTTGKKVEARWYDPRNGDWREIGVYSNTGVREFAAPATGNESDWVLVLDGAE